MGQVFTWVADVEREKDELAERLSALEEEWAGVEGADEGFAGEPEIQVGGSDPLGIELGEASCEAEGERSEEVDEGETIPKVDGSAQPAGEKEENEVTTSEFIEKAAVKAVIEKLDEEIGWEKVE